MSRPRGSRNRRTLDIQYRLERLGCDPIEGLARIGQTAEREGDLRLAAECYRHLAPFVAPKLRASVVSVETADTSTIALMEQFKSQREWANRELKKIRGTGLPGASPSRKELSIRTI